MHRKLLMAALLVAGLSGRAATAGAQDQRPIFRAKVDAVTLDVTAIDKSGRSVADLTAADFEVVEQGKPQTIETFERINLADRPPMSSNLYHEIRSLSSQAQELARRESRIIVIFLNDYHVFLKDQWQVRMQVADVVREIDPRDLVAIMYPLTMTSALTFSRDHDAQARQIEAFEGRQGLYDFPKNPIEEEHIRQSGGSHARIERFRRDVVRTALEGVCVYLGTIRDTRKTLLFVSDWAPGGLTGFEFDDFKRIQRAAARGNTAIYTWDPQGLLAEPPWRPNDWLLSLADQTGGRATVNTNNGRKGMLSLVADSEAYYLIGYTSTENVHDGKFHDVKIRVKRPGVELRAKKGYWAYDAEAIERAAAPPPPPVDPGVTAALEAAETPDQGRAMLAWAGFDRDASGAATVSVVWEAGDLRAPIDHADVTAVSDTSSFRGRGQNAVTFPARPGDLSIRVAASAADGSPVETMFVTVTVPAPAAVQLATPKFFRGRTARAVTATDATPTASREFTRQDQVAVRAHAWAMNGAATAVTARLLSDHGDALQNLTAEPASPGYASIAVPVGALGLGRYVIEITATSDAGTARALAAFRVK